MHQSPPKIPARQFLDRAISLLGNRAKHELRSKAKQELEELIGEYPEKPEEAVVWKSFLKKYKKDPETAKQEEEADKKRMERFKKAFKPKRI